MSGQSLGLIFWLPLAGDLCLLVRLLRASREASRTLKLRYACQSSLYERFGPTRRQRALEGLARCIAWYGRVLVQRRQAMAGPGLELSG